MTPLRFEDSPGHSWGKSPWLTSILENSTKGPSGLWLGPQVWGFPHSSVSKESACSAGDLGLIPGLGRSSGEGNGNPLQYSRPENPMDRGAWQVTDHGIPIVGHDLATKPPPPCILLLWVL